MDISKANERKGKVKRGKYEEVNGQGGKEGCPGPCGRISALKAGTNNKVFSSKPTIMLVILFRSCTARREATVA